MEKLNFMDVAVVINERYRPHIEGVESDLSYATREHLSDHSVQVIGYGYDAIFEYERQLEAEREDKLIDAYWVLMVSRSEIDVYAWTPSRDLENGWSAYEDLRATVHILPGEILGVHLKAVFDFLFDPDESYSIDDGYEVLRGKMAELDATIAYMNDRILNS